MPPVSPTSHPVKSNEQSLYQIERISPMSPFNCRFSLQESYIYLFSLHSTDCLPFSGTDCLASGKPSCLLGDYPSYRRAGSKLHPFSCGDGVWEKSTESLYLTLPLPRPKQLILGSLLPSDKCLQELALVYHALDTFCCLVFSACLFSSLFWQNKRLQLVSKFLTASPPYIQVTCYLQRLSKILA